MSGKCSLSNKRLPRFAGAFIISLFLLNNLFSQETNWTWNWQDSSVADISQIKDPELLYQYYRLQMGKANDDEAMLAAYTLIFRHNKHPLTAQLQKEMHSDILNNSEALTKSQRLKFKHFRQYYLHRLPAEFQKEWLTAYYYQTGHIDSVEWLARKTGYQQAKIEMLYHYAETNQYAAAQNLLWELPIENMLKDSMMIYLDSLILIHSAKIPFSLKFLIPAYSLIRYKQNDKALRLFNSTALMIAGLSSYLLATGANPILSVPYALATEACLVLINRYSAQDEPIIPFSKRFPKERIKYF
jgi:hypothetical protein